MTDEEILDKAVEGKREIARKFKAQDKNYSNFTLDRFRKMGLVGTELQEALGLVDLAIGIGRIMVMQEMNAQKQQHAAGQSSGYSS